MIKKLSSVLLCLCLLGMLFVPAFAADGVTAAVDTALTDGTLTVTVQVPAETDLATLQSTLQYDADKLELSEVVFGAGDLNTYNAETAGQVSLYMVWSNAQQEAGTLVTVTFKVKDGATGSAKLAFTDTAATDSADAKLAFNFGANTFDIALSDTANDAPNADEKIPSTAGKYMAAGSAVVLVAAAAVVVSVAVKRKKDEI